MAFTLSKIKKILAVDLVKVSSATFFATGIKFISNFLSAKIIAVFIGPVGIAIFGQLTNGSAIFLMLASGAINMGITKYLAEYTGDPETQKKYVTNAFLVTLYCSLVVSLLIAIFGKQLSIYLFASVKYEHIVYIMAASLIFSAFHNILLSVINGFKLYKKFVRISIISSLLMLVFTVLLVKKWEVDGALIAYIISQSLILAVSWYYVRKELWLDKSFWRKAPDKKILLNLSRFTVMTLVSTSVLPLSAILIRKMIVARLSFNDAGIWEGMNRISAAYLTLITASLQVYYLPRLAELKSKVFIKKEILQAYSIILPILLIICLALYFTKSYIITILFTGDFASMKPLFFFQLIGDFFKIASFLIAFLMWAKGLFKMFIFTEIFFSAAYVIMSYFGLVHFGLQGTIVSYAVMYFAHFVFFLFFFRRYLSSGETEATAETDPDLLIKNFPEAELPGA